MSESVCRSQRGTIWNWYEQYASDVCDNKLAGDYRSRERGFRLVEEVEDSIITDPDPFRIYRGESRRHLPGFSQIVFRSRCHPDATGIGVRLAEVIDD
jgi:hypothetical protein